MPPPKPKKNGSTFRAAFDPTVITPNKIRAALASLEKEEGREGWEEEVHFFRRAGVNTGQGAAYRDLFKTHIVEVRKNSKPINVWCVDPKFAAKERRNLGLANG